MQAERDKQSVEECIQSGSNCSEACDAFAKCNQCTEEQRPYEEQNYGYDDGYNTCDDRYAALAAEE